MKMVIKEMTQEEEKEKEEEEVLEVLVKLITTTRIEGSIGTDCGARTRVLWSIVRYYLIIKACCKHTQRIVTLFMRKGKTQF
jgi:hypothetical protein